MYFQPHHSRTTTPNHPQLDSICDPRNQTHSSHSCSEEDEAMIVLEALQMEAQTTNDETEDTEDEAAEAEDMFDADAPLMSPTGSHNSSNNNNNSSNNCIANNNSCGGGGGIRQSNPSSNINFDNCNANVYCGQKAKQLGPITSGNQTSNCPTLNANANANPNPNLNLNPNPSSHTTNSHSSSQANANANPPPNTTNNITAATLVAGAAAAAAATGTAATSTATNLQQNQNISSSLEIILSPIIQSSRR